VQTLNFDLTSNYLSLVANYISLMILLSRVEDRRAVLGLFNVAYEMHNGHVEPAFPRLGQIIVDFEAPLRRLCDDFVQ
jgi:NCK-associated protein 1